MTAIPIFVGKVGITMRSTHASSSAVSDVYKRPELGGTWSPVMTSGTGVFDPVTDAVGPYAYTITNSCRT